MDRFRGIEFDNENDEGNGEEKSGLKPSLITNMVKDEGKGNGRKGKGNRYKKGTLIDERRKEFIRWNIL